VLIYVGLFFRILGIFRNSPVIIFGHVDFLHNLQNASAFVGFSALSLVWTTVVMMLFFSFAFFIFTKWFIINHNLIEALLKPAVIGGLPDILFMRQCDSLDKQMSFTSIIIAQILLVLKILKDFRIGCLNDSILMEDHRCMILSLSVLLNKSL
jgi:hypothetical protein